MIKEFQDKYRFLSNFYPAKIIYEGIEYPSSEYAYQAAKSLNIDERYKISKLETPGQAKRYGKTIKIRKDWEQVKLQIMEDIVRKKFKQNSIIAEWLKNTGNQQLVEGNKWNDVYWGICNGKGENYLGKILMKIRDELNA